MIQHGEDSSEKERKILPMTFENRTYFVWLI